jgi:hypothetical protein
MSSSDYSDPFPGQSATTGVIPPKAEETLRNDAQAVVDTAKTEFDKVKQEATAQASDLAEAAKAQIADVTEKAKGLATEQKDLLAGQIGGVAEAMERVATDLEGQNASSASYARMIADGATRISDTVRNNDVDTILSMAQDFGRKQPAALIGAAALLGFAASRFLLASAKREDQRVSQNQTGSAVDYNGTPNFGETQQSYGAGTGSDYPSEGRF